MPTLSFTPNLLRHVDLTTTGLQGATLGQVLEQYFQFNPRLRSYVLDDQGGVRKHVAIFLNQLPIHDRAGLSDTVSETDEIFVAQALSGG